jgi:hypothetical protein
LKVFFFKSFPWGTVALLLGKPLNLGSLVLGVGLASYILAWTKHIGCANQPSYFRDRLKKGQTVVVKRIMSPLKLLIEIMEKVE